MKINHLSLHHFRNYSQLDIEFNSKLTIITGENAQGKTNLLEAIFLLAIGKSYRAQRDQELIQWNQTSAMVEGIIEYPHYDLPLSLVISSKGKVAKVNHLEQRKLSDFVGNFNVVLFAPEDLQFVKGPPSIRRRFLNAELGQAYPVYLRTVVEYERILKQRNTYLKNYARTEEFDEIYFQIMTEQFIEKAVDIVKMRLEFIRQIEGFAQSMHHLLSKERDEFRMEYSSSSSKLNYEQVDTLADQFKALFDQAYSRELKQQVTLYGPHRDDLKLWLNEREAQQFASQGQQRTIALSIKLAELEWFKQIKGHYPVLLLDDVLSELDDERQFILMDQIENRVQTFLTTASINHDLLKSLNQTDILYVHQGQVQRK